MSESAAQSDDDLRHAEEVEDSLIEEADRIRQDESSAATTEPRSRFWAAHKRLSFFRNRWRLRHEPEDPRPWFEASIIFQARDMAQAEFLFERMTDDALDCNRHGPDEPCPHFRVGGLHQVDDA